jgi:hypothetical protein
MSGRRCSLPWHTGKFRRGCVPVPAGHRRLVTRGSGVFKEQPVNCWSSPCSAEWVRARLRLSGREDVGVHTRGTPRCMAIPPQPLQLRRLLRRRPRPLPAVHLRGAVTRVCGLRRWQEGIGGKELAGRTRGVQARGRGHLAAPRVAPTGNWVIGDLSRWSSTPGRRPSPRRP